MLLPRFFDYSRRLGYRRRWFLTIIGLQLFAVLFEGIGIGIILPILEFVKADGDTAALAADSRLWQSLLAFTGFVGLPISLFTLLVASFVTVVMRQLFIFLRDIYTSWVMNDIQRRIRDEGFHRFLSANLEYHDRVDSGSFVNEMTTELISGLGLITNGSNFIGTLLLSTAYAGIVFILSPQLTLVALGVLLAVSLLLARYMSRIKELGQLVTSANQQMSGFLVERLKAVRLVRLSGIAQAEESAFNSYTRQQRDRNYHRTKMIALLTGMVEPMIMAIGLVFLYYAVNLLHLDLEILILFFFILIRLIPLAKSAIQQRQAYLSVMASVDVILHRFEELDEARDPVGGSYDLKELKTSIKLQKVSFKYPGSGDDSVETAALRNISLTIPAGKMTALVGPSGAGKSTLIELLPRLRTPQSGKILYDGVDYTEFTTKSLRQAIAVAPQLPQIFNVSVADHIRYGKPDADEAEIIAAARLAHAHDFIMRLPQGYETQLNVDGTRLSGGERQRLDLARALVRRAAIVVLDEPTSNLDAESESRFRDALRSIRQETDMTILIIGHRLSTVQDADQIVVLMDGEIAEVGVHESLIRGAGWYAKAFASQGGDRSFG